jgi:hypothetical protein
VSGRSTQDVAIIELALILASGYLRLVAARVEKVRSNAVSAPNNRPNPLDVRAQEWPPVGREDAPWRTIR